MSHQQPLLLLYSETTANNIAQRIGQSEYSYYFVLKWFKPALEKIADVRVIENPAHEADEIYEECKQKNRPCVLFSFAPPHKTIFPKNCPIVPLVAWEFERIPDRTWNKVVENDWRINLKRAGRVITHSEFAKSAILRSTGTDVKCWSIPAPVWDRFSRIGERHHGAAGRRPRMTYHLHLSGAAMCSSNLVPKDSETGQLRVEAFSELVTNKSARRTARRARSAKKLIAKLRGMTLNELNLQPFIGQHEFKGKGVTYAAILNPRDHRKNFDDILTAFCLAFQDTPDATLILKFNEKCSADSFAQLRLIFDRFLYLKCRVIAFNGYLPDEAYDTFLNSVDYVVNASTGEGQCLPLMEMMSMGIPAIAPLNTSMLDYINEANSFIVEGSLSPTSWPHDPSLIYSTYAYRANWESLRNAYISSYKTATTNPDAYQRMSSAATETLKNHCSTDVINERIRDVLQAYEECHPHAHP